MKNTETKFLLDDSGAPITAYHGTYYIFDYFRPLTHFGTHGAARCVLDEGKWLRNDAIDINRPIVIPVRFRNIKLIEMLDLNDHSYVNWRTWLFAFFMRSHRAVAEYLAFLGRSGRVANNLTALVDAQTQMARQDIVVPADFDFVCQPMTGNLSTEQVEYELRLDNLYDVISGNDAVNQENLFNQRMIQTLENRGIGGLCYKNWTECAGENSYIILRPSSVVRMDKKLPKFAKNSSKNKVELKQIRAAFGNAGRALTSTEKVALARNLYEIYRFNKGEQMRVMCELSRKTISFS